MKTGEAQDVFSLGRIAAGDAEAFEEMFDRRAPAVLGFLVSALGERVMAEKVLEDVFRDVWTLAGRYRAGEESPLRWMLSLARSRAAASRRRCQEDGNRQPAPVRTAPDRQACAATSSV